MRIEAEIKDPTHLELKEPLALPAGRLIVLEVVAGDGDAERTGFLAASAALLERAFAADEPDYSEAGEPL